MASPALRVILLRASLLIFFASSIWALLPLVASSQLGLGSGGYGLLLGSVGVGAVVGAALLPRLNARLTPGVMLSMGSVGLAGVAIVLGYVHVTAIVALCLVVGGTAWILALSTLNSLFQLSLPQWVKARGMAYYLVVFQGGNAVGSAVLGITAERIGLSPTFLIAGVALLLGPLVGLRYRFQSIPPQDLVPAGDWPQPVLAFDGSPIGPVMVTIEYYANKGQVQDMVAALEAARFSRRRTGATSWRVWQDAADPDKVVEQFVVASWEEHLRQHERVTLRDQERLDKVQSFSDPSRSTIRTHWLTPQAGLVPLVSDEHPGPGPTVHPKQVGHD
jgi:MFS family permease